MTRQEIQHLVMFKDSRPRKLLTAKNFIQFVGIKLVCSISLEPLKRVTVFKNAAIAE